MQPESVVFPHIALSATIISIPLLHFLAKYNKKVGQEINSQAILVQAKGFKVDMYSSMIVVIGILSSYLGATWTEALVGVVVSIFVLKAGIELGKDTVLTLMDAILHPEKIAKMTILAKEVQGVLGVRNVRIRKAGPFCFGEMVLEVEEKLSVAKAHAISEEVEQKLKRECEQLEMLMVHIEPVKRNKFRIAIPIESDKGLESVSSVHSGKTRAFIFVDVDNGNIKNWIVKSTEPSELTEKGGIADAKFLVLEKTSTLLAEELEGAMFHVLRDNLIDIYTLKGGQVVREAVESFLNGDLEKMVPHTTT